ncbi:MAG: alpha/beta fold hydrolase [bacterium]
MHALILCVTHPGGQNQVSPSAEIAGIFRRMVAEGSPEAKAAAAPALFAAVSLEKKQPLIAEYAAISLKYPVPASILTKQWEALAGFDAWDRLPQISAPTLVLSAAEDSLIPPANAGLLADRIPGSELLILQEAGHQVLIEQAELANAAVLAFLKKHHGK